MVTTTESPSTPAPATTDRQPSLARRLLRRPTAVACLLFVIGLVGIAILAPILLPDVADQEAGDLFAVLKGPSATHPLGTDSLGRDVLDRLLVGTRPTLVGVTQALVVAVLVGVPAGLAAGFLGKKTDRAVSWFADLVFAVPSIIIILVVLAVFPENMAAAMVTFGVIVSPGLMRVVRSGTLAVREELYVAAARVAGLSRFYIISRHILPRIAGSVIVQASLVAGLALLAQSGLAFLRLVVAEPAPSWGGMVADGVRAIVLQPWLIWPPGVMIALTIVAIGLLGDSLRDALTEGWSAPPRRPVKRTRGRTLAAPAVGSGDVPDRMENGALLSMQGVTVSFASPTSSRTLVEGVDLQIRPGETVGVVGESGCGKSLTSMAILGLLPAGAYINAGRIVFDGHDMTSLSERELRRIRGKEIALISQEPMVSMNPSFRIGWQLREVVQAHNPGLSRKDADRRVLDLLAEVRLPDPEGVIGKYPHELSGGMAQRVAIARALAGSPKLLIADEPTTALDVTVQAEILDLLRSLQRDQGLAILLVTHDWGVVADICDRAIVMYAGQVVESGSLDPMFDRPLHPYTHALMASNPHYAPDADILPTIPGSVPPPGSWPRGCRFQSRCVLATPECAAAPIPITEPELDRETRCIHHHQIGTNQ